MKVRVTSAFVLRFNEALEDIQPSRERRIQEMLEALLDECHHVNQRHQRVTGEGAVDEDVMADARLALRDNGAVPRHTQVEDFLERLGPDLARVLKHHLLEALLADTAQAASVGGIVPTVQSTGGTEIRLDTPPEV